MLSNLNEVGKHYYDNGISKDDDTITTNTREFETRSPRDSPTSPVVLSSDHDHLD